MCLIYKGYFKSDCAVYVKKIRLKKLNMWKRKSRSRIYWKYTESCWQNWKTQWDRHEQQKIPPGISNSWPSLRWYTRVKSVPSTRLIHIQFLHRLPFHYFTVIWWLPFSAPFLISAFVPLRSNPTIFYALHSFPTILLLLLSFSFHVYMFFLHPFSWLPSTSSSFLFSTPRPYQPAVHQPDAPVHLPNTLPPLTSLRTPSTISPLP